MQREYFHCQRAPVLKVCAGANPTKVSKEGAVVKWISQATAYSFVHGGPGFETASISFLSFFLFLPKVFVHETISIS